MNDPIGDASMTEGTVNIPLLRKAVEWAEVEAAKPPELREWKQGDWRVTPARAGEYLPVPACGTTYCIAGYVCAVMGDKWLNDTSSGWLADHRSVPGAAASHLGLSQEVADELFRGRNTIEDVRRIAEDIAGERL